MELTLQTLVGKTFSSVEKTSKDEIVFTVGEGEKYRLYHEQDCCETVNIEDICGELSDLVGPPLLQAEESSNRKEAVDGTTTWTFYRFATIKGSVVIRWVGESNGFYSETVDFERVRS